MRDDTPQPPTERDLAEWDAEIEAEFQRVIAADKAAGRKKRGQRMVGASLAFLADVCRLTEGRATLVVAELIYRRTCVSGSRSCDSQDFYNGREDGHKVSLFRPLRT
jgi:hypothetical protein